MTNSLKTLARIGVFTISLALASRSSAQTYTVLHMFSEPDQNGSNSDGTSPIAGLLLSSNLLFGAASGGGATGRGVIYRLNANGTGFTNLHSFNGVDGMTPTGPLISSSNVLYGTTTNGGAFGNGTIFSIKTDGSNFTNIYSFTNKAGPWGGLVLSGNQLFGTTTVGDSNYGSVFRLNSDGSSFTNLHFFQEIDGERPFATLLLTNNVLYGTTLNGGTNISGGTVFSVNTDGTGFELLKSFSAVSSGSVASNSDGSIPYGNVLQFNNILYATTYSGGTGRSGAIFALDVGSQAFLNLHSFSGNSSEGARPQGGLILSDNLFYGTTTAGGSMGGGVIYKIEVSGSNYWTLINFDSYHIDLLHPSGKGMNGGGPACTLVKSDNVLYGTTRFGGIAGKGVVFAFDLTPTNFLASFSSNQVVFSVPRKATNYLLQVSTDLASTNWTTLGTAGTISSVPVTNSTPGVFYRLLAQ